MATLNPISLTNYTESLRTSLSNSIGATGNSSDSLLNTLAGVIGSETNNYINLMNANINSLSILNATGLELDSLVFNMYGISRIPGNKANALVGSRCVEFYVDEGTFGNINNGNNIVIPKGTLLSVNSVFDTNNVIQYETDSQYILSAGLNRTYVGVIARSTGSQYNLDRGLVFHNFQSYTDNNNSSLKVRNNFPIINGRDRETDSSFRIRAGEYINSRRSYSIEQIRNSGINVPGILELRVIPNYYGLGTVGVICIGQEQEMTDQIVATVQQNLTAINLLGAEVTAFKPVSISVTLNVKAKKANNSITENEMKELIKREIDDYFSTVTSRNNFSFNNLNSILNNLYASKRSTFSSINEAPLSSVQITKTRNAQTETITLTRVDSALPYSIKDDEVLYFDSNSFSLEVVQ